MFCTCSDQHNIVMLIFGGDHRKNMFHVKNECGKRCAKFYPDEYIFQLNIKLFESIDIVK